MSGGRRNLPPRQVSVRSASRPTLASHAASLAPLNQGAKRFVSERGTGPCVQRGWLLKGGRRRAPSLSAWGGPHALGFGSGSDPDQVDQTVFGSRDR